MQSDEFEEVLRFWFPDLSTADHAQMVQQFQWWFRGGADAAICEHLPTCSWEKTFFSCRWDIPKISPTSNRLSGSQKS